MTHSGPVFETGAPGAPPPPRMATRTVRVAKAGASLGTVLAVTISWSAHKSILWAIVHGILSWVYVVYYALTR